MEAVIAIEAINKGEYLLFVIGLIIGLALSRIMGFVGTILAYRQRITFCPIHFLLMIIAFVIQVHYWWMLLDTPEFKHVTDITFAAYLRMMVVPLIMFAATSVLCPKFNEDEPLSLPAHFREQSATFYLLVIASLMASALQGFFVWDEEMLIIWIRLGTIGLILLLFWTKNRAVHLFLALVLTVIMVGFIFVKTESKDNQEQGSIQPSQTAVS